MPVSVSLTVDFELGGSLAANAYQLHQNIDMFHVCFLVFVRVDQPFIRVLVYLVINLEMLVLVTEDNGVAS